MYQLAAVTFKKSHLPTSWRITVTCRTLSIQSSSLGLFCSVAFDLLLWFFFLVPLPCMVMAIHIQKHIWHHHTKENPCSICSLQLGTWYGLGRIHGNNYNIKTMSRPLHSKPNHMIILSLSQRGSPQSSLHSMGIHNRHFPLGTFTHPPCKAGCETS